MSYAGAVDPSGNGNSSSSPRGGKSAQGKEQGKTGAGISAEVEVEKKLDAFQRSGIATPREEDVWRRFQAMWIRYRVKERAHLCIPGRGSAGGPRPERYLPLRCTVHRCQMLGGMVGVSTSAEHCRGVGFTWKQQAFRLRLARVWQGLRVRDGFAPVVHEWVRKFPSVPLAALYSRS